MNDKKEREWESFQERQRQYKEIEKYVKEEEKEFRYDVTIGFKVKAKDRKTARAIIEEEIEFINPRLVTDEIWFYNKDKEEPLW